ncbi:MAG: ferritin-like domain-containing protein [Opitutaceae bacterium]
MHSNSNSPWVDGQSSYISRRGALKTLGLSAAGLSVAAMLRTPALGKLVGPPNDNPVLRRNDYDILNFALNLEYLEAEYYTYATTGLGIEAAGAGVTGTGVLGQTTVKANPMVPFATQAIREYANEIAADELQHVNFLRAAITALGGQPVARPAINLQDSFMTAAELAGLGSGFDPFANEVSFLIGAFVFEDVGVTAYKGAAPLIGGKDVLEAAAGLLAVEAYHASAVRLLLYQLGDATRAAAQAISDLRDTAAGSEKDQGVVLDGMANIVPTDGDSLAFSRSAREVLNIVYLGGASSGGFFPNGLNGTIR